eukprot:scaffold13066_cov47-Prasinocladus_malaysianus.AAC.1
MQSTNAFAWHGEMASWWLLLVVSVSAVGNKKGLSLLSGSSHFLHPFRHWSHGVTHQAKQRPKQNESNGQHKRGLGIKCQLIQNFGTRRLLATLLRWRSWPCRRSTRYFVCCRAQDLEERKL